MPWLVFSNKPSRSELKLWFLNWKNPSQATESSSVSHWNTPRHHLQCSWLLPAIWLTQKAMNRWLLHCVLLWKAARKEAFQIDDRKHSWLGGFFHWKLPNFWNQNFHGNKYDFWLSYWEGSWGLERTLLLVLTAEINRSNQALTCNWDFLTGKMWTSVWGVSGPARPYFLMVELLGPLWFLLLLYNSKQITFWPSSV